MIFKNPFRWLFNTTTNLFNHSRIVTRRSRGKNNIPYYQETLLGIRLMPLRRKTLKNNLKMTLFKPKWNQGLKDDAVVYHESRNSSIPII